MTKSVYYIIWIALKRSFFPYSLQNISSLAIELYQIKKNLSTEITSSIFPPRLIKYNLQTQSDFFRNSVNSRKYGLNSLRFFASKI